MKWLVLCFEKVTVAACEDLMKGLYRWKQGSNEEATSEVQVRQKLVAGT